MKKTLSMLLLCIALQGTGNAIDSWSSPETISTAMVNASNPRLAVDTSGNSVAVWLEGTALIVNSLPFGGSWGTPTTLAASGASEPQVVIDGSGVASAIWTESGAVKTASSSAWGTVTTLSGATASSPAIATDSNGDLVAVWLESGIVKSKTNTGAGWSSVNTLSSSGSSAPQVAIGDDVNNTVVAVWQTLNGITSINNINSATKTISGAWSSVASVSDQTVNTVYPQVAVDSNGNALAVWFRYDLSGTAYSNVAPQSSYLPNADSWSTPVDILYTDPDIAYGNKDPANLIAHIKFNQLGQAMIIWTNSLLPSNYALYSAVTLDGLTWEAFSQLQYGLYNLDADLAANSVGDAYSVYMALDPTDSTVKIYYVESHIGSFGSGGWTSPQLLSASGQNAFPVIGAALTGATGTFAQVAWLNFDGSNTLVQTSTGTGSVVLPASNLSASQGSNDLGVFQEYYNTLTWTASSDPNLSSYVIFRNGEPVDFVNGTENSYVDNNQAQNGTVIYGVAAVDNIGDQSATITYTIFP